MCEVHGVNIKHRPKTR